MAPPDSHGHQQQLILLHTDRCGSLRSLLGKPRRFYQGHFPLTSGCLPREVSDLRDSTLCSLLPGSIVLERGYPERPIPKSGEKCCIYSLDAKQKHKVGEQDPMV